MEMNIYLGSLTDYSKLQVQQDIQDCFIAFKKTERWWFKPAKEGSDWVEKPFSDEAIMNAIDKVCLFSGLKFYTPMRGNIGGWQLQRLSSDMLASRRWLTYFRAKDEVGKIQHPPRDIMRVMVIDAFLRGHAKLKANSKHKNRRRG